jgi:insertion element IS1 protein InsB
VWVAYDRDARRVCAFQLGRRDRTAATELWQQLDLFNIKHVCTDDYPVYEAVIPSHLHHATKAETSAVEGLNSRIRHYLARFHRKTFCYSKALHMVQATLTIFFTENWMQYLY